MCFLRFLFVLQECQKREQKTNPHQWARHLEQVCVSVKVWMSYVSLNTSLETYEVITSSKWEIFRSIPRPNCFSLRSEKGWNRLWNTRTVIQTVQICGRFPRTVSM